MTPFLRLLAFTALILLAALAVGFASVLLYGVSWLSAALSVGGLLLIAAWACGMLAELDRRRGL